MVLVFPFPPSCFCSWVLVFVGFVLLSSPPNSSVVGRIVVDVDKIFGMKDDPIFEGN